MPNSIYYLMERHMGLVCHQSIDHKNFKEGKKVVFHKREQHSWQKSCNNQCKNICQSYFYEEREKTKSNCKVSHNFGLYRGKAFILLILKKLIGKRVSEMSSWEDNINFRHSEMLISK